MNLVEECNRWSLRVRREEKRCPTKVDAFAAGYEFAQAEIDRLRPFEQRCKELERLVCSEYRVVLVGIMDDFELWRVVATEYESELINGEVIERDTQQAAIAAAIKLLREKAGDAT